MSRWVYDASLYRNLRASSRALLPCITSERSQNYRGMLNGPGISSPQHVKQLWSSWRLKPRCECIAMSMSVTDSENRP
ncbi:hypothetical protein CERSUDRAFT_112907 [Gelatoporia subvermispora B]|uniref:Uncharacterized protein n=1 Tax=Ceriporiopsis subvermispora (strain B) TaxID=914234 RepID=M2RK88_CERS8|nr:hypothetical protein CERSUDRAFT_112907 [Gelatoporia subvermispora B]